MSCACSCEGVPKNITALVSMLPYVYHQVSGKSYQLLITSLDESQTVKYKLRYALRQLEIMT